MSERYRVPKRKVAAEIRTARDTFRAFLFLGECAEHHSGPERPSELLNTAPAFLPVEDESGGFVFLRRDSPVTVTVSRKDEWPDEWATVEEIASDLETAVRIAVILESGGTLEGTVHFQLPEDHSRLQDFLNGSGLFFALAHDEGDRVSLVNKQRVARVLLRA